MFEVPTMRFDPNQAKCDNWCDYPVADRSLAIAQWSKTTDANRCSHVMMVETDYVYVKSPPASILKPRGEAVGFEYSYIGPKEPNMLRVLREYLNEVPHEQVPSHHPARSASARCRARGTRPVPGGGGFARRRASVGGVRAAHGDARGDQEGAGVAAGHVRVRRGDSRRGRGARYRGRAAIAADGAAPGGRRRRQRRGDGGVFVRRRFCCTTRGAPRFLRRAREQAVGVRQARVRGGQYQKGPYELTRLPDPGVGPSRGAATADVLPAARAHGIKLALVKIMIDEINAAVVELPRVPKGFHRWKRRRKPRSSRV